MVGQARMGVVRSAQDGMLWAGSGRYGWARSVRCGEVGTVKVCNGMAG